ncbi:hypothetical protein [Cylindrospermum sp. FACHB-282]|uniref:hypothetical protein n=1 Tax=Cylindrospermum sp. FACHB-282 TaxID=2692794 RepID=UPI001685C8C7|nr:hypothetical protein [Cylindrospermum sp. FACHB-282]MBD2387403.1 hypothetical protein [Cylindrospermum sp. FACHB-282]
MPFNTLLLSCCLLPGRTSHREDGVEISLQPASGETVLFFNIDDQSNPNCKFRQLLGLDQEGSKICDLIVFYVKGSERIICFVELKGGDIKKAKDQVIETYTSFNQFLRVSNSSLRFTAKTYIVFNGSVPREVDTYKEELKYKFGEGNYAISRNSDFGAFVRGEKYQPKGKRKKSR